jgi:hypothetical protein
LNQASEFANLIQSTDLFRMGYAWFVIWFPLLLENKPRANSGFIKPIEKGDTSNYLSAG